MKKRLMALSTSFHLKFIRLLELSNWQSYPTDYIQHDFQKNLKASQKIPRTKMDFLGNDVNITRVAIE